MAEWNKMGRCDCDTMLGKYRDLPSCVEDLNKQIKAMQLERWADEAEKRLLKSYKSGEGHGARTEAAWPSVVGGRA